jgi:serine/threonine protein kinase
MPTMSVLAINPAVAAGVEAAPALASGSPSRSPCESPVRIKHWEPVRLVWEGSMSLVYLAQPEGGTADRPAAYALKVLRPECEQSSHAIAMVQREALVGRNVSHPHLISVLSANVQRAPYFLVMPWLTGATLAEKLSEKPSLGCGEAIWIARQTAEALQGLHEAGWLHGDVKPLNIFLSPEGHATLLDLGFARRIDARPATIERCMTGTFNYIAPELLCKRPHADVRSDLYSLGAVLFEMLAGRVPFVAADGRDVARQHREQRSPDPRAFASNVPGELASLTMRLLAKEPLRRVQSARELVDELVRLEIAILTRHWSQ